MIRRISVLVVAALTSITHEAIAQPVGLREGITIRRVLSVGRNTIRIAKDPRDNTLYIAAQNGDISRIDLAPEGEQSSRQLLYTAQDHGVRSDWGIGFVVDGNGTMYFSGGTRDGLFSVGTIAKGVIDPSTQERIRVGSHRALPAQRPRQRRPSVQRDRHLPGRPFPLPQQRFTHRPRLAGREQRQLPRGAGDTHLQLHPAAAHRW